MRDKHPYAAHDGFARPASASPALSLVLACVLAFELSFYAIPSILPLLGLSPAAQEAFHLGATPGWMFASTAAFAFPAICLVLAMRRLHKRGLLSLIGPVGPAAAQFWRALKPMAVFLVGFNLFVGVDMTFVAEVRPLTGWLMMLPFALLAVMIQTSTEELFYRGYLQQQMAAVSRHPVVWMGLPCALFGVSHVWNGATMPDMIFYVLWAFAFGLMAADLTARTGTLGAALAFHFANNTASFLLFGSQGGPWSGFALVLYEWDGQPYQYIQPDYPVWTAIFLGISFLIPFILWLLARIALEK